jgi:hypothetical protein
VFDVIAATVVTTTTMSKATAGSSGLHLTTTEVAVLAPVLALVGTFLGAHFARQSARFGATATKDAATQAATATSEAAERAADATNDAAERAAAAVGQAADRSAEPQLGQRLWAERAGAYVDAMALLRLWNRQRIVFTTPGRSWEELDEPSEDLTDKDASMLEARLSAFGSDSALEALVQATAH